MLRVTQTGWTRRRSCPGRGYCTASGKLRHNCQLLAGGTALYGCRGNEARKREQAGPRGTPGQPIAMSSITTLAIDTPARRSVERTCDDLAVLALGVIGLIASLTFRDYGLGWDDYTHAEYADLLLRMYGSGFKDTAALSFANLYMYGGGFDMVAALLHKVIPLELFETRRLVGAVVGVVGLAVTWRLGRRVGGPLAGLASLLLLALCPIFYGHMFMNPKDAPFAVAMIILMLGLVRLAEEYPKPSPRTILIVGLGAGLSIGSRILGGLALVYAMIGFVPLFLEELRNEGVREAVRRFAHFVFVIPPMAVLGGIAFAWTIERLRANHRAWQPVVLATFCFGLALPLAEMIRLHPYQYTHFNHIAGTVRAADDRFMLDYWGLALKQGSDELREQLIERQEVPPRNRKWKVAVCGPQRPAQVALGPDFTIGWDSNAADFAMTLGEFYCKGLTAPVLVEIKRDDVVFARVYDIRGRSISSLLSIPAP